MGGACIAVKHYDGSLCINRFSMTDKSLKMIKRRPIEQAFFHCTLFRQLDYIRQIEHFPLKNKCNKAQRYISGQGI